MRASNAEEANSHGDSDPWEVFTQLAILIVEGRTPGGEKGYHAGPHCSLPHQVGGNRHLCDPTSSMCIKVESLLRQLRLMWGVGVGVSVEVLVAPECEHGAAFTNSTTLDATTAPSSLLRLIEQWNFTIFDRNIPDATSNGWSLLAAVRSFLHFSQLSAWLSVSSGARPPYILYRLTVTSPVFCSKFESDSEEHTFPVANLGQDTAIKVAVRSVPRCSQVPVVICHEHHEKNLDDLPSASESSIQHEPSASTSQDLLSSATADYISSNVNKTEGTKTEEDLRRCMMRARLGDPSRVSRSQSPDTQQLGESLLDPPNSLARIPRRFQSPSRSGSPSLETPEHIICRVRQPGPSPGRPPDLGTFCQPLVVSARPPISAFSWTQTRYPSTQQPSYPSTHQQQSPFQSTQHTSYAFAPQSSYHNSQQPSYPSAQQTSYPTTQQTSYPTTQQTSYPSTQQTSYPSTQQTSYPSTQQTSYPSTQQTSYPSTQQTSYPSTQQTSYPSTQQTSYPSTQQASYPTPQHTSYPNSQQTSYPIQFNAHSIHSEMFHSTAVPSAPLPVDNPYNQSGVTFRPFCPNNNTGSFYSTSTQQYWPQQHHHQSIPPPNDIPTPSFSQTHPLHLYQMVQKSEPGQNSMQLLHLKSPLDTNYNRYQQDRKEHYQPHPSNQQLSFFQPEEASFLATDSVSESVFDNLTASDEAMTNVKSSVDQNISYSARNTTPVLQNLVNYEAASSVVNRDIKEVSETDEEIVDCCSNAPKVSENQGTKRKGASSKESPRKRESPPHIFFSKSDNKFVSVEETSSRSSCDGDDLLKRKNDSSDDQFAKKYSPRNKDMVNDQLWPRCSQQGKHLCSSVEDLAEMSPEKTAVFTSTTKNLRNEKKQSCSKLEESCPKVSFDLTPKETQEILNVLRQNTPVPPLRIDQRKNSTGAATCSNVSDLITFQKDAKGLKIRRSSQDVQDPPMSTATALTKQTSKFLVEPCSQSDLQSFWCHTSDVPKSIHSCVNEEGCTSTSSNKPCDISYKKSTNYMRNTNIKNELNSKRGGKYLDTEEEEDDDGTIEDGLSTMELEKIRSVSQSKNSDCIEARTVTQKTSYFTVSSQPASRCNDASQISQALMKSPLSSVLSSIKSVSLQCSQNEIKEECKRKVRRVLQFEESSETSLNHSAPLMSSLTLISRVGKESALEEFTKGVNIFRDLMKKSVLSSQEKGGEKEESECSISNLNGELPSQVNSVHEENEEKDSINCFQNGLEDSIQENDEKVFTECETSSNEEDDEVEDLCCAKGIVIPSTSEKVKFRRSLDSAANLVFHNKTGLPLTSSPAPLRKGTCFDFDSTLNSVAALKSAFRTCESADDDCEVLSKEDVENIRPSIRTVLSASAPTTVTCSNLLGSFEECVLNGRLEPVSTVHGFSAEIAASGSFCPKHTNKPVTVFFYTLCDNDQISSPYMGHINLGKKGYHIPKQGTVQVTLFNPHGTVVKMFVVMYDLTDMPPNSKTFLRQRTLNMPVGATDTHPDAHQWLRYLIHLRFASSKSGKIYLHTDIRLLIFRKSDADAATLHKNSVPYELRSFTHGPTNPKFSPRK